MATLYKNRNIWYITVSAGNNRLTRSLRTKDKQVAKQLMPSVELELLSQLSGATQPSKNLPFDELVRGYLIADHNWSKRTRDKNSRNDKKTIFYKYTAITKGIIFPRKY